MTINFHSNSIEMTKKFAKAASRFGSDEYKALQEARKDYPGFKVVTITRKSTAKKESYKGLTYEYMEAYIIAHDDEEKTAMTAYLNLRGETQEAIEAGMVSHTYMQIKLWFLEQYPAIAEFHAAQNAMSEAAQKNRAEAREQMKNKQQQERIAVLMAGKTA